MKLDRKQEEIINDYIFDRKSLNLVKDSDLLTNIEIGIVIQAEIQFTSPDIGGVVQGDPEENRQFNLRPEGSALMILSLDAALALSTLDAFKAGLITDLTIRVDRSWRCYINCGDRIIEKTCKEDKESTFNCCATLRKLCR